MRRAARFEVFGKGSKWYVRLRYSNGKKALASESYTRERDAWRAAKTLRDEVAPGLDVHSSARLNSAQRLVAVGGEGDGDES